MYADDDPTRPTSVLVFTPSGNILTKEYLKEVNRLRAEIAAIDAGGATWENR